MNDRTATQNKIVIERTFDAPIEMIWQLWTQPEHFKKWYAPEGLMVPVAEMDVRVGGKHLVCMERQTPEGSMSMWTAGVYLEVSPYTRLIFTDSIADEQGNVISSAERGMNENEYPTTTEVTVVLEDLNGRTKMVMTHSGVLENAEGAKGGWTQAFNKMAAYVDTVIKGQ